MSLTALLVILMLGVEIFRPMRELRTVLHQGMVGMSAAQGIYQILDGRPVVADAPPAPLSGALEPSIAFEAVRFRYPGTRRTVHDGLDFRVGAGERIGIVGGSGGGKSSIVRLLLRFYDPEAGAIRLDGHDLRALSFAQIRSMIALVNQDTFLFHGTVEENIRLGNPNASESKIEAAAKAANIHEFILTLPQGYRTTNTLCFLAFGIGFQKRPAFLTIQNAKTAQFPANSGAIALGQISLLLVRAFQVPERFRVR